MVGQWVGAAFLVTGIAFCFMKAVEERNLDMGWAAVGCFAVPFGLCFVTLGAPGFGPGGLVVSAVRGWARDRNPAIVGELGRLASPTPRTDGTGAATPPRSRCP